MEVRAAVVVALFWKASRLAVSVAVPVLSKIKGRPVAPELETVKVVWPRDAVEEAWRLPEIWRGAEMVEEAVEI